MHIEPVGESLSMDLKMACFTIAFFLLLSQTIGMMIAFVLLITKEGILMAIDVDYTGNVIFLRGAIALFLVVLIAIISFTVVVIVGLHRDDHTLIRIYLVFSSFILTFSVYCFFCEFAFVVNPVVTLQRSLTVVNAAFLCTIRSYWIKLETKNQELEQYA